MEVLEKYYQEYLWRYPNDVNWIDYNIEMQLIKDKIERILKVGYLSEDDIEFIYSLLPDIEDECIKEDLRCFFQKEDNYTIYRYTGCLIISTFSFLLSSPTPTPSPISYFSIIIKRENKEKKMKKQTKKIDNRKTREENKR